MLGVFGEEEKGKKKNGGRLDEEGKKKWGWLWGAPPSSMADCGQKIKIRVGGGGGKNGGKILGGGEGKMGRKTKMGGKESAKTLQWPTVGKKGKINK